ncbi:uncharacterized protein LOC132184088 isoform X1 [Corylus avellana]|uniref:uncharacterized protein LOC132184088 isoform X1 n=2 Tax=Corylus avellana TaxID=13451 RepID=UPI00286AFC95|nr:uncharacterized protein LOC132184088 isoform X1 [Corylus avellana]
MPRKSKRKASAPAVKSSDVDPAPPGKALLRKMGRIDCLYDLYANQSIGLIDPEGIEALCSDVGVGHTDVRILMLAWKMKAERQGYFSKDEWRTGLTALNVNSLDKLKKALPALEKEVMKPSNFVDFYAYAFQYCLTEEKQRFVDVETFCQLLNLVLGSKFPAQVDSITEYLKLQSDYQMLSMDQWMNFYRFCCDISFPDLQQYDPLESWAVIVDNFVEWLRKKQS